MQIVSKNRNSMWWILEKLRAFSDLLFQRALYEICAWFIHAPNLKKFSLFDVCLRSFHSGWYFSVIFTRNEKFSVCWRISSVRKRYGNEKIFTVQDKTRRAFGKSAFNAIFRHLHCALRFCIFFFRIFPTFTMYLVAFKSNFTFRFEIRKIFLRRISIFEIRSKYVHFILKNRVST